MNELKLYEIADGYEMLMNKLEAGELEEADKQEIEKALSEALVNKSSNIIGYYLNEKSFIESIDAQIKRLQDLKRSESSKLENYKEYVKYNMQRLGIEKIETSTGKLSLAKSPVSVDIIDEKLIPAEYKEEVVTVKVDKKKIADNFKETGEIIDGVKINYDNKSLRIK